MGSEPFSVEETERQLRATQEVEEYLKEIDASKLVVYTGINPKAWSMTGARLVNAITQAIQALGAHVYNFTDAHELLEKIQTAPPDLVIVQIGFGDMAGLGFVDLLGDNPRTRLQPVLVITRVHTWVKFEAKDKDRYLAWDIDYIVACYLQQLVLAFLSRCKQE